MIIGNFTFDQSRDEYVGEITTMTLQRTVVLRSLKKVTDKEPDYRLLVEGPHGIVEFGAAWKRRSERGSYLSVAIDDPALPGTLNAALFPAPNGEAATLVWNRPKRKTKVE